MVEAVGETTQILLASLLCALIKGGGEKKNDESDVHLPQRKKKSSYLLYFIFIFIFIFNRFLLEAFLGRFVTRGIQKHEKNFFPKKIHLGSSQKMRLFFPPFFFLSFPSVVLFDFF
jgi:hypothetical protein